jgi:hypothetical protein
MAAAYDKFPDDETKLFYGLSILGAVPEGSTGFEQQGQAAKLFENVYLRHPDHPGVLHYLIHAYDDPEHAQQGLKAARAYAQAAAAVPPALHMPSHIFTRLALPSRQSRSGARDGRSRRSMQYLQGSPRCPQRAVRPEILPVAESDSR